MSNSIDLIKTFLKPIAPFLDDPDVSEIMINCGGRDVFVERSGQFEHQPDVHLRDVELNTAVKNIARVVTGDELSVQHPIYDGRLPDGSRVAAILAPCSADGTTLTIRKFQNQRWTLEELERSGALPAEVLEHLTAAIGRRKNVLIVGGTGTGKTTMLNALASLIPDSERLVIIEDTSEIQLHAQNLVRLEARKAQPSDNPDDDIPAVTIRDLVKAVLRHRPDRIILGEIRGAEAFDLLQALNTGHSGSLSTIHANSAAAAVSRFSNCVTVSGVEIPHHALQAQIADALDLLLYIERRHGRRYVAELAELRGYDPDHKPHYDILPLYRRELVVTKNHSGADQLAFKVYNPGSDSHAIVPLPPKAPPAAFLGDLVALSTSTQGQPQPGAPQ
jgi:pilus assembly protein CpaF